MSFGCWCCVSEIRCLLRLSFPLPLNPLTEIQCNANWELRLNFFSVIILWFSLCKLGARVVSRNWKRWNFLPPFVCWTISKRWVKEPRAINKIAEESMITRCHVDIVSPRLVDRLSSFRRSRLNQSSDWSAPESNSHTRSVESNLHQPKPNREWDSTQPDKPPNNSSYTIQNNDYNYNTLIHRYHHTHTHTHTHTHRSLWGALRW